MKCELTKDPTWIIDPIGFQMNSYLFDVLDQTWIIDPIGFQIYLKLNNGNQIINSVGCMDPIFSVINCEPRKIVKSVAFRWDDQLRPQQPKHLHHPRLHGGKGQTSPFS